MVAITPSGVAPGAGATFIDGICGAVLPDGAAVYLDTATNTYKLADADAAASALCAGITMHPTEVIGQPVRIQTGGIMTLAASGILPGVWYYVGLTPGDIVPFADITTGDFPSSVCKGLTATTVLVLPVNATVAL